MKVGIRRSILLAIIIILNIVVLLYNLKVGTNYIMAMVIAFVCIGLYLCMVLPGDTQGLSRKNKSLLLFSGLTRQFFALGAHIEFEFEGVRPFVYAIIIVLICIVTIIEVVLYYKIPTFKNYKYIILFFFEVMFCLGAFCIEAPWLMFAPFALLVVYTMYFEVKFVVIASVLIGILNIVCVYRFLNECINISNIRYLNIAYGVQIMYVILFAIALSFTLVLNDSFNTKKINKIKSMTESSETMSKVMLNIAKKVKASAICTNEEIDNLEETSSVALALLEGIAHENEENSSSVDMQTHMTNNIADMLNEVNYEADKASLSAKNSLSGLGKSKLSVKDLKNKSNMIVNSNKVVIETINEFVENARLVKEITNGIVEISEQTNLLSLNASIESAKAGDIGKGFSVVAQAIRGLADGTSMLTKDIDKIVHMLEINAMEAQSKVGMVVEAISEENIKIEDALNEFEIIENDIKALNGNMDKISIAAKSVSQFNSEIVKHAHHLELLSRTINENTKEALALSKINSEKVSRTKMLMKDLLKEAKKIDEFEK